MNPEVKHGENHGDLNEKWNVRPMHRFREFQSLSSEEALRPRHASQ